jgi:hypothetical protein
LDILPITEVNFGYSTGSTPSEKRMDGYIKEFRYWNWTRSAFEIDAFKSVKFNLPLHTMLIIYWRLDEDPSSGARLWNDSAAWGVNQQVLQYDVGSAYTGLTRANFVHEKTIYLRICPEGTYSNWDKTINNGIMTCLPCDNLCKNCDGPTSLNCT